MLTARFVSESKQFLVTRTIDNDYTKPHVMINNILRKLNNQYFSDLECIFNEQVEFITEIDNWCIIQTSGFEYICVGNIIHKFTLESEMDKFQIINHSGLKLPFVIDKKSNCYIFLPHAFTDNIYEKMKFYGYDDPYKFFGDYHYLFKTFECKDYFNPYFADEVECFEYINGDNY